MSSTAILLDDALMEKIDQAAARSNSSRAGIIGKAVEDYLARRDRADRMLRETDEALADMEAGRLVDGEDIMTWLASWGQPDELPPPK